MDWEPEVEVLSDDMDSEFNVTESFGGDDGHVSSSSSGQSECSDEYSDDERGVRDGPRRSRRRRKKRDKEITTSSGRRVKKRNLDECDGSSHKVHQKLKSKYGRKAGRKKSSKGSRPRRAAARNALTLFSKITGNSTDQDEYETEGSSSETESALEYSEFESEDSDKLSDEKLKTLKGKEIVLDETEEVPTHQDSHESHDNGLNRARLILKLPYRDPKRDVVSVDSFEKSENLTDMPGSSSKTLDSHFKFDGERGVDKVSWVSRGYIDDTMKWGGVKTRTPKRIKLSTAPPVNGPASSNETENNFEGDIKPAVEHDVRIEGQNDELEENRHLKADANKSQLSNGLQEDHEADNNGGPCSLGRDFNSCSLEWTPNSVPTRLRFVTENSATPIANPEQNGECSGRSDGVRKSDGANTILLNSQSPLHQRKDRMFSAVYRRSRSFKATRPSSDCNGPHVAESTSNTSGCQYLNGNVKVECSSVDGVEEARPVETETTPEEHVERKRSAGRPKRYENASLNSSDKGFSQEWGSGKTAGLRSTRNRRVNFVRDASPVDRRRPGQAQKKLSWLMLSIPDSSRYIPQQGDEVAYLRQGHHEFLSSSRTPVRAPWDVLKGEIRAVEFCKVIELDYSTVPGSGDSCCKLTLKFIDDSSSVSGKTFKLSLPEVSGFPDFLVERTRYEAAIQRNWTTRDKCQVWWKNEDEEDGSWWEGRIFAVKAKSPEFPDSPWERYLIRYKSEPTETHSHSPWELHDANGTQWEQPHLNDPATNKLLSSLLKLLESGNKAKDNYGVQKLRLVSEKTNFLNRFPVPLSLDVIQSRLENNYYRSLEAVQHDVNVVLSNAESYFSKNAEISKKIARMSDWFTRLLSGLEH
ncbi:hypothetical protein RND81_12G140300 [Saponaria officinalis]